MGNSVYVEYDEDPARPLMGIDTLMFNVSMDDIYDLQPINTYSPLAVRCEMTPCVQTYTSNVVDGIFVEKLVSSKLMSYIGGGFMSYFSLVLPSIERNHRTIDCTPTTQPRNKTDLCSHMGATPYDFSVDAEQQCWPKDCVWNLNPLTTGGMQIVLVSVFCPHHP
jgi:hypothetical protein